MEAAPTVPATTALSDLALRWVRHDPEIDHSDALFVVGGDGALQGVITRRDVRRVLQANPADNMSVLDAATRDLAVAYPDESLSDAVTKMLAYDVGRLPVVDRCDAAKLLGYLTHKSSVAVRARRLAEEHIREAGCWRGLGRAIPQLPQAYKR
jgi:CBS domain-containing protein